MHISPINISVHTMNPELRVKMMKNRRAGKVLEYLDRLAAAGITLRGQIVLCRGYNDGKELARTLRDLLAYAPLMQSVSVVPVGLTRHREGLPELTAFTRESAAAVVEAVTQFGNKCVEELGTRLVFCSDELYLTAGRELPPDEFYEEHVQLENGVGMLRLLEAEFESALKYADAPDGVPFSIAAGAAAAPMLEKLLFSAKKKYDTLNGKVYTVPNDFFGRSVTVSGLVTGGDLIAHLRGRDLGERLLISADMLRREEVDFLDSVPLRAASDALGVPIYPIANDGGALCDAMFGILPPIPQPAADAEETEYNKYN